MRLAFSRQIPVALWTVFCLTSPPTDARKPFLTAHIVHQKSETGDLASAGATHSDGTPLSKPGTGIPRILHQTYNTSDIPDSLKQNMESWDAKNPGWDMRFYNDTQCLELVERDFPQYAPAYKALPKPVEKADFFRYMVVLSQGGFYADLDTNCWRPLDSIVRPEDRMLVGWEDEFSTFEAKEQHFFGRQRQVLQWLFGAVAGHPVLRDMCDRIANTSGQSFSEDTNADTEERTGPGLWTDVVLEHARANPPKDNKGYLRLLPRTVWGALPKAVTYNPNRVSLHYSLGSWKADEAEAAQQRKYTPQALAFHEDFAKQLFPVSIDWEPPFTMLVPIKEQGDRLSGMDVAETLSLWGGWHYPTFLIREPTVAEALLGHFGPSQEKREVLLDIGAGNGYFSLAAAALGHRALAFEVAPKSVASFNASMSHNGFEHLVTLNQVALGRRKEAICLDPWLERSHEAALGLDVQRGYGLPQLHALRKQCKKRSIRRPARSMLPRGIRISAIHISVTGWEGWILESLKDLITRSQPGAIMVESYPDLVEGMGFPGGAERVFDMLTSWGYTQAQHMGYQCVERRLASLRLLARAKDFSDQDAVKQPGWCKLLPGGASQMISAGNQRVPEILLFQRERQTKVPEFWLTEELSKP